MLPPDDGNGLRERTIVQTDKIMTAPKAKLRGPIGRLGTGAVNELDGRLRAHLSLTETEKQP